MERKGNMDFLPSENASRPNPPTQKRASLPVRALCSYLATLVAFSTWMPLLTGCNPVTPPSGNADLQGDDLSSDGLGLPSRGEREGSTGVEVSLEIPHRGYLDLFHSVSARGGAAAQDSVANSLYAIRTLVVQDLLKSRAALKAMLGGTSRARRVGSADLSFAVPGDVKTLYLFGPSGLAPTRPTSSTGGATSPTERVASSQAPTPAVTEGPHGFETDILFPEIANSIAWVENTESLEGPQFEENQSQLSRGLMLLAASLARMDQHLKYIENDFWADARIRAEFERTERHCFVDSASNSGTRMGSGVDVMDPTTIEQDRQAQFDACKESWMRRHGMDRVREQIQAFKSLLAQRYNILNLDMGGVLLYQQIYDKMVALGGFPSRNSRMSPARPVLPRGTDPIPFESTFDEAVEAKLDALSLRQNRDRLDRIVEGATIAGRGQVTGTAAVIDAALIRMLAENTTQLTELCRAEDRDYRLDSRSALIALARYPELWAEARARYQYLGSLIDFDAAEQSFLRYFAAEQQDAQLRRYGAYAGVIGLTVAAFFTLGSSLLAGGAVAGTGAAVEGAAGASFLGLSSGTWVTGTALATTALAGYNSYQSTRSHVLSQSLFYGSARSGNARTAASDTSIAEADYHLFISSLLNLGVSLPRILNVTKYARILADGAVSRAIVFSNNQTAAAFFSLARQGATRVRGWASVFPGLGGIAQMVGRAVESPVGVVGFTETLTQALDAAVVTTRLSRAALMTRLSQLPVFAGIFRAAEQAGPGLNLLSRIKMRPGLIPAIINENIMGVTVSATTQILTSQVPYQFSSWQAFYESAERNNLLRNVAIGSVEGTVLMVMLFGRGSGIPATMYDAGLSTAERLRRFTTMAGRFGAVGFSSAFLTTLATNSRDSDGNELSMNERISAAAARGLYEFGFFALSSSVRMQLTNYINSRIFAHVRGQQERMDALRSLVPTGADGNPQISRLSQALQAEFRALEGSSLVLHAVPPAVTGANDFFAWYHYLKIMQLTGVETADRRVHLVNASGDLPTLQSNVEITGLQTETLGRAFMRMRSAQENGPGYFFDFMN
jgi:hypothetical protein